MTTDRAALADHLDTLRWRTLTDTTTGEHLVTAACVDPTHTHRFTTTDAELAWWLQCSLNGIGVLLDEIDRLRTHP